MIGTDIEFAKALLESGEVVAIPTETVYGLAGNAMNENAVKKIFAVKERPHFNPLIIHVKSPDEILKYVIEIPDKLKKLSNQFMPGPLTLLLDKKEIVPNLITANSSRVAIRIPYHPLTIELLNRLDFPLAAPSANPFGYVSPTNPQHVFNQLGNKIPYILDGGQCEVGLESTIVGIEDERVIVYRKGGLSLDLIIDEIGEIFYKENNNAIPITPGMLLSHYSPKIPLVIGNLNTLMKENQEKNFAVINFTTKLEVDNHRIFSLSKNNDFDDAAKNLFKILREIDELGFEIILAELLPEENLGIAINDRLRRAAYR